MNDKVMKPWTPVRVREDGETIYVGTWGRENKSGKSSFLESMRSQGKELLAAPVRVVGTEDGREFIFSDYDLFSMNDRDESFAETLASAESDEFVINLSMKTEFDGFIDTSLTVAPKGRSVKQIFGLEKLKAQQFVLERLWIEIPLNKEVAKYYQMFPRTQNTGALEAVGAIEENITLSVKPDSIRIDSILKDVDLYDRIESLPLKKKSIISRDIDEKGIDLSGGESQKLSLARAIYKDSPLMILDEPTSAMDAISESNLYTNINKLINNHSAIFISHRLSSTKFCDRIIMLDNGRIIESGTHQELLNENGEYAKLFNMQAEYYKGGDDNA